MRCVLILVMIVFGCSSPQPQQPVDKKKPTKAEMCADPNADPEVLRLFCQ